MADDPLRANFTPDALATFHELAQLIYEGTSIDEVYRAVCVAATLMVTGCDHASVLMRGRDGKYATVAASDHVAADVDTLECAVGDGPCLDAIETEAVQIDADLASRSQWPSLAACVLASTPVRGAMGFRMLVDGHKVGALNLFSDTRGAFDTNSAAQGVVLASFASVAVSAAAGGQEVAGLRRALQSNREIGKAIGMLMVLFDITDAEAFDRLRQTSQDMNIKLADVAARIVAHPRYFRPDGPASP
ncbi:GAF and ANTAR domain-containing protein [Mycolicibacterium mucogenicum]|uniref:GAF and ANTAR domain-containing protein n=1 Tax=Mycolicibacterium TaxID=1866885 RepID=UPI002269E957|nr:MULTISPECIES: GAF and ANTAR domain-containing protein [Mycolicibacterium]MCX8561182.1 GAF and ANTAR domain-containing protein [Mycolicibacterium mucogenicum]